jgi:hypothetical protein
LDDEEGNILPAVPAAEKLRTSGEVSACHDQQSDTPVHDAQQYEGLSVHLFLVMILLMMIKKMRLIVDLSRLSPALKVQNFHASCVYQINIIHLTAGFQEQSNNRTSLLEEAETVLIESIKSGSRVVLVKGVAWNT